MRGVLQLFLIAIVLAGGQAPAAAWAPETRVRMVDEALRLMPAALRRAFETHREALLRGMLEPMATEDSADHRPPWSQGRLEASVEAEVGALLETLRRQAGFDVIARRFGAVAHYVADAGFPPGASKTDGARRYASFSWFCEDRRGRFPVVFYGHEDPALAAADWRGFAVREMTRASDDDLELARAYRAAGDSPDPAGFDDRSVPFAVGSLAYSRSITNIARVWLNIWEQAGGDMGRIPYWNRALVP
jgi:hypothetical protein